MSTAEAMEGCKRLLQAGYNLQDFRDSMLSIQTSPGIPKQEFDTLAQSLLQMAVWDEEQPRATYPDPPEEKRV